MSEIDGIGVRVKYILDENYLEDKLRMDQIYAEKCQFSDDVALLATTREGMKRAIIAY